MTLKDVIDKGLLEVGMVFRDGSSNDEVFILYRIKKIKEKSLRYETLNGKPQFSGTIALNEGWLHTQELVMEIEGFEI